MFLALCSSISNTRHFKQMFHKEVFFLQLMSWKVNVLLWVYHSDSFIFYDCKIIIYNITSHSSKLLHISFINHSKVYMGKRGEVSVWWFQSHLMVAGEQAQCCCHSSTCAFATLTQNPLILLTWQLALSFSVQEAVPKHRHAKMRQNLNSLHP